MSAVFKLGDRVTWGGAASPHINEHVGEVVAEIPAGFRPINILDAAGIDRDGFFHGLPRNHISYVVRVGSKLYWPRVAQLRLVSAAGDEGPADEVQPAMERARRAASLGDETDAVVLMVEVDRLRALLTGRAS